MYFCCFGHSLLFLKSKGFLGILDLRYISLIHFFFHSFNVNNTVRGRIKCYWLIVFLSFIFLGKNKTKFFWFVRSTLLCSPRHFRVFVILHSTTIRVEYNFWIENTYGYASVRIVIHSFPYVNKSQVTLHPYYITWYNWTTRKSKWKCIKGVVSNLKENFVTKVFL